MLRLPLSLALLAAMASLAAAQESTAPLAPAPDAAPEPPAVAAEPAPPSVPADPATIVARVNGTEVTLAELALLYRGLPDQYKGLPGDVLYPALLEQLVNQILLAGEGEKTGVAERPAIRLALENARRDEIARAIVQDEIAARVTEDKIRAAFDARIAEMPAESEVNASHILVETQEKAVELIAQIQGGAAFADVAKANGTDPTGPNGGELGWFARGQMVPAFEEAVFALKPGELTPAPVQTQFGWHVIRVNEVREKAKPAFETMRDQIAGELSEAAITAKLDGLRTAATIERPETGIAGEALKDPALLGQ